MNNDKIVLDDEDQFEINYRDHLINMIKMMREMMESHIIPIKFDEYKFEEFIKDNSKGYDKMKLKYESYLKELEKDQKGYY